MRRHTTVLALLCLSGCSAPAFRVVAEEALPDASDAHLEAAEARAPETGPDATASHHLGDPCHQDKDCDPLAAGDAGITSLRVTCDPQVGCTFWCDGDGIGCAMAGWCDDGGVDCAQLCALTGGTCNCVCQP